jgi:hypothetical protein
LESDPGDLDAFALRRFLHHFVLGGAILDAFGLWLNPYAPHE